MVVSLVALPLALLLYDGSSIVGLTEESTGYRYYHSLRILSTPDERPWLPQGQLLGLAHMGLHVLLSAVGHPPTELFPRIEWWAYIAATFPILPTVVAFWWAIRPMRSPVGLLLAAVGLLLVALDPHNFAGQAFIVPDYYAWALPAALVTAGWLVRIHSGHRLSWPALALYTGALLAMKSTFVLFAFPIYLLVLLRSWRTIPCLAAAGVGGIVVGLLLIATYYRFDVPAFREHLVETWALMVGGSISPPVLAWITSVPKWPPPSMLLACATPVVLLPGLLLPCRRTLIPTLLLTSVAALYSASQRWYGATFVETTSLHYAILLVYVSVLPWPRSRLTRAAAVVSIAIMGWITYEHGVVTLRQGRWAAEQLTIAGRQVQTFLDAHPGKTRVLILDNAHRPLTVDSAISKGGTDIHNRAWGVSPYVAALYPDRDYLIGETGQYARPVTYDDVETVVFVVGPAMGGKSIKGNKEVHEQEWAITRTWLRDSFDLDISQWNCPVEGFAISNSLVVACARP
ncbi:MAG: hypothetical protein AB7K36_08390 [Chloroflexota bacterium]